MPLANRLLDEHQLSEPEPVWPLDLVRCVDCSLVQITETVPAKTLFRDYAYLSSCSSTMVEHARALAQDMCRFRDLDANSLVVEVASNDGYLLQWYREAGIPVLGIDPARNVARMASEERGIPTIPEFFGRELAEHLRQAGRQATVLHASNVLAHVHDLNGFVAGLAVLLEPGGIIVVECPYVRDLIDYVEFDTIYH